MSAGPARGERSRHVAAGVATGKALPGGREPSAFSPRQGRVPCGRGRSLARLSGAVSRGNRRGEPARPDRCAAGVDRAAAAGSDTVIGLDRRRPFARRAFRAVVAHGGPRGRPRARPDGIPAGGESARSGVSFPGVEGGRARATPVGTATVKSTTRRRIRLPGDGDTGDGRRRRRFGGPAGGERLLREGLSARACLSRAGIGGAPSAIPFRMNRPGFRRGDRRHTLRRNGECRV